MSIEVIETIENPDGTTRITLDVDPETLRILIESAVCTAIKDYIAQHLGSDTF